MKTRNEYLEFFQHMEIENKKESLGGMAWDEVAWWIHDAIEEDKLFSYDELHNMFPSLIRSQEEIEREKTEIENIVNVILKGDN